MAFRDDDDAPAHVRSLRLQLCLALRRQPDHPWARLLSRRTDEDLSVEENLTRVSSIRTEARAEAESGQPSQRSVDEGAAGAEADTGDSPERDEVPDAGARWEEVVTALLDEVPKAHDPGKKRLVQSTEIYTHWPWPGKFVEDRGWLYMGAFVTQKRVGGRYTEHESMNHTWIEMLSGVSPSTRALVVSTHSETVVDPFRDCPCERRALELIQQCDIALRTQAEEPAWDLLRIELLQAFR